jgi:hypothetical protein
MTAFASTNIDKMFAGAIALTDPHSSSKMLT